MNGMHLECTGTTTADKTFVFRRGRDCKLRLVGHHSSLPYVPPGT